MSSKENHEFEVSEEGLDYDILDASYNDATQAFLLKAGLKPGMTVLDANCGTGIMTAWLAKQVGPMGQVFAIDDNEDQLEQTIKQIKHERLDNVETNVLSAHEIDSLHTEFDLIYCRFLLHLIHSPRSVIQNFFEHLKPDGLYIGEEAAMHMAYAYPSSFAWSGYPLTQTSPEDESRDGDIGIKLFYECQQAGFNILDCQMHQPLLWKQEQKAMLIEGVDSFKKTDLAQGMTEEDWQKKYDETLKMINDPQQLIGFYASCQIAAKK